MGDQQQRGAHQVRANASTLCDMFLTHLVVRAQHAKTIRQDVLVRAPPSLPTHVRAHPLSLAWQHRHLLRMSGPCVRPRDRCTTVLESTSLIRVLTRHRCSQLSSPPPVAPPASSSSASSSNPCHSNHAMSQTQRLPLTVRFIKLSGGEKRICEYNQARARIPRVPTSQPLTPGCGVRAGGLPIERLRWSQEPDSLVPIQRWGACHRLLEPA